MTGGIGHDHQRVGSVVGSIVEHRCAKRHGPLNLTALLRSILHTEVEMDLLGDIAAGPRRPWQRVDLLNGELGRACRIVEHDEVRVVVRALVWPVPQTQELLPERREGPSVLGVEARRDELGRCVVHAVIDSISGDTSSPNMRR